MKILFYLTFFFSNIFSLFALDITLLNLSPQDLKQALQEISFINSPSEITPNSDPAGRPITGQTVILEIGAPLGEKPFIQYSITYQPDNPSALARHLSAKLAASSHANSCMDYAEAYRSGLSSGENFDGLDGKSTMRSDTDLRKWIQKTTTPGPAGNKHRAYSMYYHVGDGIGYFLTCRMNGLINLVPQMDLIVKPLHHRRIAVKALDQIETTALKGITQNGILKSLQVKLVHFKENFRKGEYKTALNMLNSFLNELSAQRGKHVPEAAYQELTAKIEIMIQAVNFLINPDPTSTTTSHPKK